MRFLSERLGLDAVALVGQHGLEWRDSGEVTVDPRAAAYRGRIAAAAIEAEHAWPELHVERKEELAVTIHWRRAPGRAPAEDALRALAERHGLVFQQGRLACELRPPVPVDKASAVRRLVEQSGASVVAFAGDDRGDLAVFEWLHRERRAGSRQVACIGVDSVEAPSELLAAADLVVGGPTELAALLVALSASLATRG